MEVQKISKIRIDIYIYIYKTNVHLILHPYQSRPHEGKRYTSKFACGRSNTVDRSRLSYYQDKWADKFSLAAMLWAFGAPRRSPETHYSILSNNAKTREDQKRI